MTLNRDNFSLVTKAALLSGKSKKGVRSGRRKNLETTLKVKIEHEMGDE